MSTVLLATFIIFALAMLVMGVGYLVKGSCLRPSCGGVVDSEGNMSCPTCGKGQGDSSGNQE